MILTGREGHVGKLGSNVEEKTLELPRSGPSTVDDELEVYTLRLKISEVCHGLQLKALTMTRPAKCENDTATTGIWRRDLREALKPSTGSGLLVFLSQLAKNSSM